MHDTKLTVKQLEEWEEDFGLTEALAAGRWKVPLVRHWWGNRRNDFRELQAVAPPPALRKRYERLRAFAAAGLAEYSEAAHYYRKQGETRLAQEMEQRALVRQRCTPLFKPSTRVLGIEREPGTADGWILLTATMAGKPGDEEIMSVDLLQVRVTPARVTSLQNRVVFGAAMNAQLLLKDLDADGKTEVVVVVHQLGGSWQPTHLFVYVPTLTGLSARFKAFSEHDIELVDLDHDGRVEILTNHCIDVGNCHGEQPRWLDIYTLHRGTFQKANERFGWVYAERFGDKLRQFKKRYGNSDPVLNEYWHWMIEHTSN